LAQELLNNQINTNFEEMLNGFLPSVFPNMPELLGEGMTYYWTLWQSEIAKDYIFESPDTVNSLMDDFLRYSLITGTGERVLKYFGTPVKPNGQPHPNSNPEILSRVNCWYDGLRVRHWNGKNSVKFYNEHNVLRFETTVNDPAKFKIYRHIENQDKSEPKKLLPMRKGIADISVRAEVSRNIVNRFTEHMSALEEKTQLGELLSPISKPLVVNGKRIRALDVFGKELELLRAISDPVFNVSSITNKELQKKLNATQWAKGMSGKQLSGKISRHLLLLRQHGLIKKLPNQRKYSLTDKGRKITASISVALASSVNDLLKLSA
jgi:DNA-binding MarR family transcriptional regulator